MPLSADLLDRKQTHFVLWHAKPAAAPPVLVIGEFQAGQSSVAGERQAVPARARGRIHGSVRASPPPIAG